MISYNPNSNGFYFEINPKNEILIKCAQELLEKEPDLVFKEGDRIFLETSAVIDIAIESMESHVMSFPEGFSLIGHLSQLYKEARRKTAAHWDIRPKQVVDNVSATDSSSDSSADSSSDSSAHSSADNLSTVHKGRKSNGKKKEAVRKSAPKAT